MNVRLNPGFKLLIVRRLRVGIGTGAQYRDEQRCLPWFPRRGIIDRNCCSRPVHKHFFPSFVFLPQHHIQVPPPLLIALAKPTVAISFRVGLSIFLPQQLQGQMTVLLQLLMHRLPIRFRTTAHRPSHCNLVPEQLRFQIYFPQAFL